MIMRVSFKKTKPNFNVQDLGLNNFTSGNFVVPVTVLLKKEKLMKVGNLKAEDGVTLLSPGGNSEYVDELVIEKEKFTKVFTKSALRLHIFSLSSKSISLFMWLIYTIYPGEDYFWLNTVKYIGETGISKDTLREAIKELVKMGIIAPNAFVEGIYWFNPIFLFNGSRINKYKEKIIKE